MSDEFQSPPPAPVVPPPGGGSADDTGKILAALGYVIWPVALVAILVEPYKNDKWLRAHAIQALALGVAIWVLTAVLSVVLIGFVVGIAGFVYQIILALKAWNGETVEIPLLYGVVKNYI